MSAKLVIVGAGGHGRELLDVVNAVNSAMPTWRFLGFLDDGFSGSGRLTPQGAPLIGTSAALRDLDASYVVGIGSSVVRERVAGVGAQTGREAAVLVHPAATVGANVALGPGSVVCAGARITTNVELGCHTHLNINAVVSHDSILGDFVTLSPGSLVNGSVTLEDHVFLGSGAIVTPGRRVGARTWVGAGAVVVDDLPADVVATGVPARVRRSR